MIDSSKKQQQSFPGILPFEDIESLKGKECLDPDIPKCLKEVLQLKLQQRRTREQLVDQGIMPLSVNFSKTGLFCAYYHLSVVCTSLPIFFQTENFLKHKIRSRPDRSELVRMHILEVGQENYPQALDEFSFDEDSSDALSPDQPGSQESPGSTASPGEPKTKETPSPVPPASSTTQHPPLAIPGTDFLKPPVTDQHVTRTTTAAPLSTNSVTATKHCSGPTLIKQLYIFSLQIATHPKNPNDRPRSKKSKEPKPRVKKLKYHQYIPPDQKLEKNEPPMDSNYARLLQQQQLFLQLQILSQQQQHYNYQTILPAPLKQINDKQGNTGNVPLNALNNSISSVAVSTPRSNTNISTRKPGPLPSSLDDLKISSVSHIFLRAKFQWKMTQIFRAVQSWNGRCQHSRHVDGNHDPDVSVAVPSASPLGAAANEDVGIASSGMDLEKDRMATEKDRRLQEKEKQIEDLKRKLEQEQKLVEVLKMQLEVEKRSHQQQQQAQASASTPMTLNPQRNSSSVKEEGTVADSSEARQLVSDASHALGQPRAAEIQNLVAKKAVVIKQEIPLAQAEPQNVISQFYVSSQRPPQTAVVAHPQALLAASGTAQLLLPLSLQGPNSATSVQLPVSNIQVQTQAGIPAIAQVSTSGMVPKVPQMHMSAPKQNASPQHAAGQSSENRKVFPPTSPNTVFSYQNPSASNLQQPLFKPASNTTPHSGNQAPLVQNGPNPLQKPPSPAQSQQYLLQQSLFNSSGTKTKDPPRYEEAIKQTRSLQSSQREVSLAAVTDLDLYAYEGRTFSDFQNEASYRQHHHNASQHCGVRPPPQVQMAPPLSLEPTSNFSLSLENQLEALLEGTLPSGNGIPHLTSSNEEKEPFSVIEDLQNDLLNHSGILDHSHSPMETSDSQFTPSSCLSLDLPDPNLDNMEWLDLTMPNASSGLTPLSSTAPSMFSTDFLDPQDLQLQWD
ncbi:hypothetical protein E2320_012079 [Naja naja]|nr:hypothetical protein E2320_012079 [Naja naja]